MTCMCHAPARPGDPRSIEMAGPPTLMADLAAITAAECATGAVVVLLDEGGHHVARILVDGGREPLPQLDAAAAALDRAREALGRLVDVTSDS